MSKYDQEMAEERKKLGIEYLSDSELKDMKANNNIKKIDLTNNNKLTPGWHGDVYGLPTQKTIENNSVELSVDDLFTIFSKFEREMGVIAFNIISKPNFVEQKDLNELFICYNICQLCERLGETRNIRVGYYKYTDLSTVQSILTQHGLLPHQDETLKKQGHTK